jgi:hypothetical protein
MGEEILRFSGTHSNKSQVPAGIRFIAMRLSG